MLSFGEWGTDLKLRSPTCFLIASWTIMSTANGEQYGKDPCIEHSLSNPKDSPCSSLEELQVKLADATKTWNRVKCFRNTGPNKGTS